MAEKATKEVGEEPSEAVVEEEAPQPKSSELLKLLWPYVRGDLSLLLCGLGALSVASYSNAMTPRLIKSVIDNTSSKDGTTLVSVRQQRASMLRAFGIFTAGSIGSYVRTRAFGTVAANVGQRLRVALFSSLVTKERSFFDGRKTASLVDALMNDVEEVEQTVTQNVGNVLRYTSSLVTGTTAILSISGGGMMLAKFAGMSMCLMPVVAIAGAKQNKKVKAAKLAGDEQRVESTSFATERLGGIQTVHSFSQEGYEAANFARLCVEQAKRRRGLAKAEGALMGGLDWTIKTAGLSLIAAGAGLVRKGQMSAGNLTSFTMYSGLSAMGLAGLYRICSRDWQSSTWRVLRHITAPSRLSNATSHPVPRASVSTDTDVPVLTLSGVKFQYPTRPVAVLDGVDLSLAKGDVLALTGSSGSGKSTIASLILKLYEPDAGTILFNGVASTDLSTQEVRAKIGVVEQDATLFSGSIRENILYGRLAATQDELETAAKTAHAHDFIMALPDGYDTKVGERGSVSLSGGERQRVAIARAILKQPELLILDEATASLDQESESIVHEALMGAMKGRTVLIIAHNDATIRLASKVARIGKGGSSDVPLADVAAAVGAGGGSRTLEILPTEKFFAMGTGVAPQA